MATSAYSESSFAEVLGLGDSHVLEASKSLNDSLVDAAKKLNIPLHKGIIHSSDVFYHPQGSIHQKMYDEHGCMCVEMESFALFANAKVSGKKAACLLTISDSLVTHEVTSSEERQKSFTKNDGNCLRGYLMIVQPTNKFKTTIISIRFKEKNY